MNRRWIGVAAAVVLAALGTWVLVRYVQSAEARALEGEETVEVLVVDQPVPAGFAAEDLAERVRVELVPYKVQTPGSVADLSELEGLVAEVALLPGEQIIASRFVEPEVLAEQMLADVPDGMVEVTISLAPERAVGGTLRPGDQVAVFSSFEPFDLNGVEPGDPPPVIIETDAGATTLEDILAGDSGALQQQSQTPNTTHLILHKVVVTGVQVEELPQQNTTEEGDAASLEFVPTGNLLVTLAMEPAQAERLVFTAEFGTLWLAAESATADENDTRVQSRNTIYGATTTETAP